MRYIVIGWILIIVGVGVMVHEKIGIGFDVQAGCYSQTIPCKDLSE